jgi:hypothetical protein
MVTYPLEASITDVARWLERRRIAGDSIILFLGARAGGLFRSRQLYRRVQPFSPRTFIEMSRIEQFGECCRVLHEGDFSKSDIDSILVESLQGLETTEIDVYLSELVKAGFFDTIISTNIDNLLTEALAKVGMKETQDFQTFIPQKGFIEDISQTRLQVPCLLVKVLGDLGAGEHGLIRNDFYLDAHEQLKTYLTPVLKNNVLMLGYDPFWDRAIGLIFPQEGQDLWYVNEERAESSILSPLDRRMGRYVVGGEGNYERFIQALHWRLVGEKASEQYSVTERRNGEKPLSPLVPPDISNSNRTTYGPQTNATQEIYSVLSAREREQRKRVFIIYSHKDKKYSQELQTHMVSYEREKLIDVWDETKIVAGTKWLEELKRTLAITRVAILLISADFLACSFIEKNILPPLLQAAEAGGAIILPVILSHCVLENTTLHQFQPFNSPSELLADKKPNKRDKVWADLVRHLITLVKDA